MIRDTVRLINEPIKLTETGSHPAYHTPSDELWGTYAKAFLSGKMAGGMLDPEMVVDTVKIVSEATKDKIQVNLIINNRTGGNAPLIARKIADRLHLERQQRLL